ncbi:MAG: radical SAM protein [archaeon]
MEAQKTKITFIHPTFPVNPRHKLVLPLSIAQIAAYLMERNKNVEVSILDSHLNNLKEEEILEEISKNKPDVIGIGYWTCQAPVVNSLSAKIKKLYPEILIVHGGIHASFSFKEALEYCDVVVIGEGEKTFAELINAKQNNNGLETLKGIAFKKDGNVIVTEKQPQIHDLDEIPSPAYELFNIREYIKGNLRQLHIVGGKRIPIVASRGCPYNCSFCLSPKMWGRSVRYRSVKKVLEELAMLNRLFGFTRFQFYDDNFLLNRKFIEELCEEIPKLGFEVKWVALSRAAHIIQNKDLLAKMKMAGCIGIEMGLETSDEEVLGKINKEQTMSIMNEAISLQRAAGLKPLYTIMVLSPGETISSIRKLREYVENKIPESLTYEFFGSLPFLTLGQFATPYPGTSFFDNRFKEGIVLMEDFGDLFHHQINFIPNSLLEDSPKISGEITEEILEQCVKTAETSLFKYFSGNNEYNENREYMKEIAKKVYSLSNGKNKISEIVNLISEEEKLDITKTLRFVIIAIIVFAQRKIITSGIKQEKSIIANQIK